MYKRTVSVDVKDADISKLPVGTKVSMTITGTVKRAALGDKPEAYDGPSDCCGCGISRGWPSSVDIEMDKQTIKAGANEFESLGEEEDDE